MIRDLYKLQLKPETEDQLKRAASLAVNEAGVQFRIASFDGVAMCVKVRQATLNGKEPLSADALKKLAMDVFDLPGIAVEIIPRPFTDKKPK